MAHLLLCLQLLYERDENRSERPVEVTTPEMVNKIHDMVLSDR